MEEIILVGFGGHAKSVVDCIESGRKFQIAGFTEMTEQPSYRGYTWLGTDDVLETYYQKGVRHAFVSVGYMGSGNVRDRLYNKLKAVGYNLPVIIDPDAVVAADAVVEEGTLIGKGAVVNSAAAVGKMCILNTGSIVEHESRIGAFTHISVNSTLCGRVSVEDHCMVGAGATVIQNITIGSHSIIGAGSVVLRNIESGETVYGIVK